MDDEPGLDLKIRDRRSDPGSVNQTTDDYRTAIVNITDLKNGIIFTSVTAFKFRRFPYELGMFRNFPGDQVFYVMQFIKDMAQKIVFGQVHEVYKGAVNLQIILIFR